MEKLLFVQYPSCSTCKKAANWLKKNNIQVESRHIVEKNPTEEELGEWVKRSKLPVSKFFNTSGKAYKDQNLKETVKLGDSVVLIKLLAGNGMLVKRPILVGTSFVLVGFKEEQWIETLKPLK